MRWVNAPTLGGVKIDLDCWVTTRVEDLIYARWVVIGLAIVNVAQQMTYLTSVDLGDRHLDAEGMRWLQWKVMEKGFPVSARTKWV